MVSQRNAANTLVERRNVRTSFLTWCDLALAPQGLKPAAHHRLLIEKLERVARGELPRLAVFMPPGSGKSYYVSVLFPPWYLSNFPSHAIIAASHTSELAERWGRRVRNLISEHSVLLGLALSSDSQAAGRWSLQSGADYLAAGVGGAIAGFRADVAVIDDPVRNRESADSEVIRNSTHEWYKSDLRTRLKPQAKQILVQTRWHEDDLAGRILADREPWEVLSLPAEAMEDDALGRAPGEMLWGDDPSYDYAALLREEKKNQPARNWSALYQQSPAPEDGDYFKKEWLKPYTTAPDREEMRVYIGSDYAVSEGKGDYTCHLVIGVNPRGDLYLLDLWRRQTTPDQWVEAFCDLVDKWRPLAAAEEQGQIRSSVGPFLRKRQIERSSHVFRESFPTKHDKTVRAQSIRGRMAQRGLFVNESEPWFADFRSELLSFPAGKHDDMVDALGLVGQLLDHMLSGAAKVKPAPPKKLDRWDRAFKRLEDDANEYTWKTI